MEVKAVRQACRVDMLKHDMWVKEAIDIILVNAKEVEAAKEVTAVKAVSVKKSAK